MTNEQKTEKCRETWQIASKKFNFSIITPYSINLMGVKRNIFAFLPEYGSKNGAIIELMFPPDFNTDSEILEYSKLKNCFCSFINANNFLKYNEDTFMEILLDWKICP